MAPVPPAVVTVGCGTVVTTLGTVRSGFVAGGTRTEPSPPPARPRATEAPTTTTATSAAAPVNAARRRCRRAPEAGPQLRRAPTSGSPSGRGLGVEATPELVVDRVEVEVVGHPASIHSRSAVRPACRWYFTAPSDSFIDVAISRTESCST